MARSDGRSTWQTADGLLRELGSLRHTLVTLERRIDSAAAAEVDELIAQATEAVRSAMDAAPSDALLLAACEAIAAARGRIELLEGPPRESQAAARAFTRQHKAARLLFERLRRAT